jgi:hypothetical protein
MQGLTDGDRADGRGVQQQAQRGDVGVGAEKPGHIRRVAFPADGARTVEHVRFGIHADHGTRVAGQWKRQLAGSAADVDDDVVAAQLQRRHQGVDDSVGVAAPILLVVVDNLTAEPESHRPSLPTSPTSRKQLRAECEQNLPTPPPGTDVWQRCARTASASSGRVGGWCATTGNPHRSVSRCAQGARRQDERNSSVSTSGFTTGTPNAPKLMSCSTGLLGAGRGGSSPVPILRAAAARRDGAGAGRGPDAPR